MGDHGLNSKAFSKIQSIVLALILICAVTSGSLALYLWYNSSQSLETIKIGILADLDVTRGQRVMEGALLAAEEINAEGGVLGRHIEIIGEDSDDTASNFDPSTAILALNRLITFHKVDFVIVSGSEDFVIDAGVEHKKILLGTVSPSESLTQRVKDDYDRYKYFFRLGINETAFAEMLADSVVHLRDITGFNKIAYIGLDIPQIRVIMEILDSLPETHGFELVYQGKYFQQTLDFSSYFAAAETAGAEIMVPLVILQEGVSLVKDWYERQSPMVLWGMNAQPSWENTEGKVEHTTVFASSALALGYPATNKTTRTQNSYLAKWGDNPGLQAVVVYDCIRFLLFDALERARTSETDAVIKALEESEIENSLEENFKFTSSHDHYYQLGSQTAISMMFQWQSDGEKAIIYPKRIMEATGATYTYPDWPGPWD